MDNNFSRGIARAALALFASVAGIGGLSAAEQPHKVYLSLSYTGNNWQSQAENMVRALAASEAYRNKIDLEVQVAGSNPQRQSQQINAMVQAGAKAIVLYPSSETLLNRAIKNACNRGVVVMAFAAGVTEPCAHNVIDDPAQWARIGAQWLADRLGGKGNVVMVTGVAGYSVDTVRNEVAREVFAKYPDMKVVASVQGMWNDTVVRSEMAKLLATLPWSKIDGLWVQDGCYTLGAMQDEAGIPDDQKRPMSCSASNGERLQMLAKTTTVEGANGSYRPMGYPGISLAASPNMGALALKYAVDIIEGAEMGHEVLIPTDQTPSDKITLCDVGTWAEMNDTGCNVFKPSMADNPGWYSAIFSPELKGLGFQAAKTGKPDS